MNESLLTARQLAERLGMSMSWVLDQWEAGALPGYKLGRAVRFRGSEVEMWLQSYRRGPEPPPSQRLALRRREERAPGWLNDAQPTKEA